MIPQVRPSQLAAWIETVSSQGQAVVLDVREDNELATASVTPAGFKLVTIPMGSIPARLGELDPAQPIACLCHHGARSQNVANFLAGHGFTQVVNIAGGINAWSLELDRNVPRY